MKTTLTLFDAIKAASVPYGNHESDLYFKSTALSETILRQFPEQQAIATRFASNTDHGARWVDVPFAFLPYWEAKQKPAQLRSKVKTVSTLAPL